MIHSGPVIRLRVHADVHGHPQRIFRPNIRGDAQGQLRHRISGVPPLRAPRPRPLLTYGLYKLLEETLDAGGHPSTTYPNALRDIVLPPSLLHKMLSVAGVSALANPSSNTHPFASPIPWRKTGVRYNNNEIFFDITEELRAIVNKYVICARAGRILRRRFCLAPTHDLNRTGSVTVSRVWGKVLANSKLSGSWMPPGHSLRQIESR